MSGRLRSTGALISNAIRVHYSSATLSIRTGHDQLTHLIQTGIRLLNARQMQKSLDSFLKPQQKADPKPGVLNGSKVKRVLVDSTSVSKRTKDELGFVATPQSSGSTAPFAEDEKKLKDENVASKSALENPRTVEYLEVCATFDKIEATTKRLEITRYCAELFEAVMDKDPSALSEVTYLCINRLGPDYEGLELGLGESLIIKALADSSGRSIAHVKKDYNTAGDLGLVAVASKRNQTSLLKPKPLTVNLVFKRLKEIAESAGQQSQQRKLEIIKQLLHSCRENEAKYLVRSLEGKLRIGLAERSVLVALSQAFVTFDEKQSRETLTAEEAEETIKEIFSQMPNYSVIIDAVIEYGLKNISKAVKLSPGIPVKPMLAKPTKSFTEILDRFNGEVFTCEYKYDGERVQIHCKSDGKVHIYSRNMEDMSQRYPDIIQVVPRIRLEGTSDFIIDAEAVAWDREQRKILPFQILSTRKRKDVQSDSIKIQVHLFAFDLLYLNGNSLLTLPLAERRELLLHNFQTVPDVFSFASHMDADDTEQIQTFFEQSIKASCEGLMVKMLKGKESGYEPSKRSRNWLKLKKDYLEGIGDSVDLVVLGAYFGRGKRTNVYGGFLLGCYDPNSEEYQTVCKLGTGFSEADLERFHSQLAPLADSKPRSYIAHDPAPNQQPDVWFEPKFVWEVLAADMTLSPVYRAGSDELGKGVSLRFPRFVREREDKNAEDSTSSEQLIELYEQQVASQKQ